MTFNSEAVKQSLLNGDKTTRAAICEQMKKLGKSGISVLISALCEAPKNANEIEKYRTPRADVANVLIEIGTEIVPELISAVNLAGNSMYDAVPIFVALRDKRALETLTPQWERMKKSGQALGGSLLAVRLPEAIAVIQGEKGGGFETLVDALDENDEYKIGVASEAADALGRWGDLRAIPHLMRAATRVYFSNGNVRGLNVGALNGLTELIRKHPGAVESDTLQEMLRLPDQYPRYGPQQVYSSFREAVGNELQKDGD